MRPGRASGALRYPVGASSPSSKDHEMTNPPNVHVFVSADGQRIALSTLPDGGNLPSITDSERWLALALVPMPWITCASM